MRAPKEILKALPDGFSVGHPVIESDGKSRARKVGGSGSHPYILKPDGKPLRTSSGVPIQFSASPHNPRSTKNDLARIKRALREWGST